MTACGADGPGQGDGAAIIEPDRDGFNGTVVDPSLDIARVTLRDTDGNPVHLDKLPPGHATAFYFGFTNCDDVCPTTMADLASARRTLPDQAAEKLTLSFVTVDPQRDTPSVLRKWLDQFDPDIVGLRGPVNRIHRTERSLHASESGPAPSDASQAGPAHDRGEHVDSGRGQTNGEEDSAHGGGGYEVEHTGTVYLFGPDGRTVIYTGGTTVSQYAADFARILQAD